MSESTASRLLSDPPNRVIGIKDDCVPGPLVLVVAGLHGNEPAGIRAFERLLARLQETGTSLRGRLVGLAGNLEALRRGVRYVDEDLNRIWQPERVRGLDSEAPGDASTETSQQRALLEALRAELAAARGPVFFLDLHTSSAPGRPFVCIGDTLRNRRFATYFPVPVILGLEEQVDGALLEYVNNLGPVTVGVEAGQHAAIGSIDFHEAFLALALIGAGALRPAELPCFDEMRARLQAAGAELPRVLEVRHRHPVRPDDHFHMRDGFENFQQVRNGEALADDRSGAVHAPETGRVLLPLYQGQGDDGYFLVREFAGLWLRVSAALRVLGLGGAARWLPGVRPLAGDANTLVVDRRVARWFTVEIFHLLGYRKERTQGAELLFSRRIESL